VLQDCVPEEVGGAEGAGTASGVPRFDELVHHHLVLKISFFGGVGDGDRLRLWLWLRQQQEREELLLVLLELQRRW
jgi:hypothetical protein